MSILIAISKKCREIKDFLEELLIEEVIFLLSERTLYYFPKVFREGFREGDYYISMAPYVRVIIIKMDDVIHFFFIKKDSLSYKINQNSKEMYCHTNFKYNLIITLINLIIKIYNITAKKLYNKNLIIFEEDNCKKILKLKNEKINFNKKGLVNEYSTKITQKLNEKNYSVEIKNIRKEELNNIFLNEITLYNRGRKIIISCYTKIPINSKFLKKIENDYNFSNLLEVLNEYKIQRVSYKKIIDIDITINNIKNVYFKIYANKEDVKILKYNINGDIIKSFEDKFGICILKKYNLLTNYEEKLE